MEHKTPRQLPKESSESVSAAANGGALQKGLRESFALAESELAAEKLCGNIVKQEYWKGELAALHRIRRIIASDGGGEQEKTETP